MTTNDSEITDQMQATLALLRLRILVLQLGALARAAQALTAQREAHKARVLTEMMQRHERLDA